MTERQEEYHTNVPSEHESQAAVVSWAAANADRYPALNLLYAIPNGAYKSMSSARKFKLEGLRSGVPDLCLPVKTPSFGSLYIEMKAPHGQMSKAQMEWHDMLLDAGNYATICHSADEAIGMLKWYLGIEEE